MSTGKKKKKRSRWCVIADVVSDAGGIRIVVGEKGSNESEKGPGGTERARKNETEEGMEESESPSARRDPETFNV